MPARMYLRTRFQYRIDRKLIIFVGKKMCACEISSKCQKIRNNFRSQGKMSEIDVSFSAS